jgi:hypothetical protein
MRLMVSFSLVVVASTLELVIYESLSYDKNRVTILLIRILSPPTSAQKHAFFYIKTMDEWTDTLLVNQSVGIRPIYPAPNPALETLPVELCPMSSEPLFLKKLMYSS